MAIGVMIADQTGAVRSGGARWMEMMLRRVLRELGVKQCAWTITVVGDAAMKALHRRTMGLGTTTDVLTFDMRDDPPRTREGAAVELDTVLCADEARRRAAEHGHTPRRELLLYAVHSLLHVQGFDDVTPAKARRMHRREDALLQAIGVGAVYAPPAKAREGKR
ncbi:MAG TPA: rRNA maturation RNase YbeY [Phycisphaerae bacterium]|nr:rRNA maturation RNase YbeY [Phycisphaerae bacterium]